MRLVRILLNAMPRGSAGPTSTTRLAQEEIKEGGRVYAARMKKRFGKEINQVKAFKTYILGGLALISGYAAYLIVSDWIAKAKPSPYEIPYDPETAAAYRKAHPIERISLTGEPYKYGPRG